MRTLIRGRNRRPALHIGTTEIVHQAQLRKDTFSPANLGPFEIFLGYLILLQDKERLIVGDGFETHLHPRVVIARHPVGHTPSLLDKLWLLQFRLATMNRTGVKRECSV
jgi:hypothetical protein